jgi:hypothetical protein
MKLRISATEANCCKSYLYNERRLFYLKEAELIGIGVKLEEQAVLI